MNFNLSELEELKVLQYPWDQTNLDAVRNYLNHTDQSCSNEDFYRIFECLLKVHSELNNLARAEVSDTLAEDYHFLFHEYTSQMPTFNLINTQRTILSLKQFGVEHLEHELIKSTLIDWLDYIVSNSVKFAGDYLLKLKNQCPESFKLEPFLALINQYLPNIHPQVGIHLLSKATLIAQQKIIPFLERIIMDDRLSKDIRSSAVNYKEWMSSKHS